MSPFIPSRGNLIHGNVSFPDATKNGKHGMSLAVALSIRGCRLKRQEKLTRLTQMCYFMLILREQIANLSSLLPLLQAQQPLMGESPQPGRCRRA